MKKTDPLLRSAVLLSLVCISVRATPQEVIQIDDVEYLQGVPDLEEGMDGTLRISSHEIIFVRKGENELAIAGSEVTYVAAAAKASIRARTADTGVAVAGAVALTVLGGWTPIPLLFHKAEKHLLSIEYLEGNDRIRRLALFNVRDHSALAVKKMIDTNLGLTPDYYRAKDRSEEERKREMEVSKTPSGYWEAKENTMVGDSQYDRVLLEKGKYAVLIFNKYVGFCPEGLEWAKYRVPIREITSSRSATESLIPINKSSRVVGFKINGKQYLFY